MARPYYVLRWYSDLFGHRADLGFRVVAKRGLGEHGIHEAPVHGLQSRIVFLEQQHECMKKGVSELKASGSSLASAGRKRSRRVPIAATHLGGDNR